MDFDKISIKNVPYNVKDSTARKQIGDETTARKQADSQNRHGSTSAGKHNLSAGDFL